MVVRLAAKTKFNVILRRSIFRNKINDSLLIEGIDEE